MLILSNQASEKPITDKVSIVKVFLTISKGSNINQMGEDSNKIDVMYIGKFLPALSSVGFNVNHVGECSNHPHAILATSRPTITPKFLKCNSLVYYGMYYFNLKISKSPS